LKYVSTVSVPAVAVLGLTYLAATHEPTELTMPKVSNTVVIGSLYSQDSNVVFDREDIPGIKYTSTNNDKRDEVFKNMTNNRYVAFLSKAYCNALEGYGLIRMNPYTDAQYQMYLQLTTPDERSPMASRGPLFPVVKSIEYAMNKAKKSDGKIDLEDMCTIARVGDHKLDLARQASKSFDFKNYIGAKDNSGKYIIEEKDQKFIKSWLGSIN
jgi:hypothetical protein